jgi:hypothetical protein
MTAMAAGGSDVSGRTFASGRLGLLGPAGSAGVGRGAGKYRTVKSRAAGRANENGLAGYRRLW